MKKISFLLIGVVILCAPIVFAQDNGQVAQPSEKKVALDGNKDNGKQDAEKAPTQRVVFNPKTDRDPTLSPDDIARIEARRRAAEAAAEAERLRKLEEERLRAEEAERLRQLELLRQRGPTREVRNKIRIGGIIDKEVFIGDKIYTTGNSIYGARIVEVRPEEVVFSYKGHTFIKRIPL